MDTIHLAKRLNKPVEEIRAEGKRVLENPEYHKWRENLPAGHREIFAGIMLKEVPLNELWEVFRFRWHQEQMEPETAVIIDRVIDFGERRKKGEPCCR